MVNGLPTGAFLAGLGCGSLLLALLHHLRRPDLPGQGGDDAQHADDITPGSLRESSGSCYKQDGRGDSADARQHEDASGGEQHWHGGNDRAKQAIHTDLSGGYPRAVGRATMATKQ